MVIIRLARSGAKKNPYYFVTVADERKPRDGAFIERLGFFNPTAKGQEERLRIDLDKLQEWVEKGAQLSERVQSLVKEANLSPEEYAAKLEAKKAKAAAKKVAIAENLAKEAADNVVVHKGNLFEGAEKYGPYDALIIQGGVEVISDKLLRQLKVAGRVVAIFIQDGVGECRLGLKSQSDIDWVFAFNASAKVLDGFTKEVNFTL